MKYKTPLPGRLFFLPLLAIFVCAVRGQPIDLGVDGSDIGRRVLHAREIIPVKPGKLTLVYPKWAPGEHMPNDLLNNLVNLKFSAGGKTLEWRRDNVEMYQFHLDVPEGVTDLEVSLDYQVVRPGGDQFEAGPAATAQLLDLCWNQVLLYPQGEKAWDIEIAASLRLPPGWKFGTALPRANGTGRADEIVFAPVTLERLVDSPLIAGKYFREVDLAPGETPAHYLDVVADSAAALEAKPETIAHIARLVPETGALFRARHYRDYHFLLTLSDHVGVYGLEHHESSDNREAEDYLTDDKALRNDVDLLAHEMTHSWNGKYRRPAGLATPDFLEPMKDDLLWVYEGLTEYYGFVLAARAGICSIDDARENIANFAATMDYTTGRMWRPLADTAVSAPLVYASPHHGEAARRSDDYYPEGLLIWLEADTIIREETHGAKSLDDFCRRFHGGESGPPTVVTYTFEDVVTTLNDVTPYDWQKFLQQRIDRINPRAPLGGIENSGWKLVYTNEKPEVLSIADDRGKTTDLRFGLGLSVNSDGNIIDVVPGSAADKAGVAVDTTLIAVNDRKWSADLLRAAVSAATNSSRPITLLIEHDEFFKTCAVDYHGGERYPTLVRDVSKPDLLWEILRPHAAFK